MTGFVGYPLRTLLIVAIGLTILCVGGCDTSETKQNSLYRKLIGSWRISTVPFDGGSPSPLTDTVQIDFFQENDVRTYRIIRVPSSDTVRTGRISILKSNLLRMGGYRTPLVWTFDFDGSLSVRLQLKRAEAPIVQEFLADIGPGGSAQRLALELLRDSG